MSAANNPTYDTHLLDTSAKRVMGTQLQAADLTLDETRPDVIEQIRREHFAAAAYAAETKCVRLQSG